MMRDKWYWASLLLSTGLLFVSYYAPVNWLLKAPSDEINLWYPHLGNVWLAVRDIIRLLAVTVCIVSTLRLSFIHRIWY